MTAINIYSQFENSADVLTDFKDSILLFYDDIIEKGGISDPGVIRALAQLRAKTDITLNEIIPQQTI